jgi:chromate transporter
MFGAGSIALVLASIRNNTVISNCFIPITLIQLSKTTVVTATNLNLFLVFLKIGAILYGSGYVLFAFLDSELVSKGLLSRAILIDAIAVGQFTPGPVFSSVTFIGYQMNGLWGAIAATIGIFLPSFLFVALLNPLVKKMRNSKAFSVFLDAVNVASIAIIVAICFQMGAEIISDWRTISIGVISLLITFNYQKINSIFIVFGGAMLGYILTFV